MVLSIRLVADILWIPLRRCCACVLAVVSVAGVTESLDPDREGESYTRTLMKFENGQTATLEMGGYPGAVYGPSPWTHRVLGTKGEVRVVGSDVLLYNEDNSDGYEYWRAQYELYMHCSVG
eukprot:COSAG02_NODE_7668_length_2903_cov_2.612340_3_plen_121_part_00